jgi:uncharacterized membrane protein YuzA (DUF378 family)
MTDDRIKGVRIGLVIAGAVLLFGISLGISFGVFEDNIKELVNSGVDAHAEVHAGDPDAKAKIFRWWQRAHFHATGIGAFTMAMIAVTALTGMKTGVKRVVSTLIGIGGIYSVAWLLMALKAPEIGRSAAHHAPDVTVVVFVSVGALLLGMAGLFSNIVFGLFAEK